MKILKKALDNALTLCALQSYGVVALLYTYLELQRYLDIKNLTEFIDPIDETLQLIEV